MQAGVDTRQSDKPRIVPVPNGPLYVISSSQPEKIENLLSSKGEPLYQTRKVVLCRCGGSKSKPFCDGTHRTSGFSSENKSSPQTSDRRKDYVGKEVTIHDNRRICSHSGVCLRNLESVFRVGERPWINPDGASGDSIIETVKKCPSGALSYSIHGSEMRDQHDRMPMVMVGKDGPYYVTGGVELADVENWGVGASKEHYALCRCGASGNKPFCDGAHRAMKFKDG